MTRQITPYMRDTTKCWKRARNNDGRCCCNCVHHEQVNGHPLVTGTPITKSTGMYICRGLTEPNSPSVIASHKHGLCEEWSAIERPKDAIRRCKFCGTLEPVTDSGAWIDCGHGQVSCGGAGCAVF